MIIKKKLKDPGSAITHFIGFLMVLFAGIPLIIKAVQQSDYTCIISVFIYVLGLLLLYAASTLYHSLDISEKVNRRLKKFDHMMISILIAGTYTPICLLSLERKVGIILLSIVWILAIFEIIFNAFWIHCPKWVSSIIYIGMGWTCILAFTHIYNSLPLAGFLWLLFGGVIYTVGGVIYALKLPIFNSQHKNFGSHEIFHLFVMGGSICHFIMIYLYVV